jgi:hypothetical protein
MVQLRWPDGVVKCPQCGSDNVTWLTKARVWKCYAKHERPTFTLKTGTIFESSPIALEKWLTARYIKYIIAAVFPDIEVLCWRLARRYALASGRAFTRRRRLLASRRFRSA